MKIKYCDETGYSCNVDASRSLTKLSVLNTLTMAGNGSNTSADLGHYPALRICSNKDGIFNRAACADPTPDSDCSTLHAQASYSYPATHPVSINSCPFPAESTKSHNIKRLKLKNLSVHAEDKISCPKLLRYNYARICRQISVYAV